MSSPTSTSSEYSWFASSPDNEIDSLCLGTGRFLRSVLVPALVGANLHPALIQTRGRTMLDYIKERGDSSYEVDTVLPNGEIETSHVPIYGAFTLGSEQGKQAALTDLLPNMKKISILGVGVTEAGLSSHTTQVMRDLYELLQHLNKLHQSNQLTFDTPQHKLPIVDMDNVPNNGQVMSTHMMKLAEERDDTDMQQFLKQHVVFLDTMVDHITSQRPGSNGMVPRCEPIPAKALVVLDENGDLPPNLTTLSKAQYGVVIRSTSQQLQSDINLKLRVANGTHTAAAHALALMQLLKTDVLSQHDSLWMKYLDALFEYDILRAASNKYGADETKASYDDWRSRLVHAHFGLSTFFITQNGAAKGGIRLSPSVMDLMICDKKNPSVVMAYAFAAILRWLTPVDTIAATSKPGVYRGWLDNCDRSRAASSTSAGEEYADGLCYSLEDGWYEFKCACRVNKVSSTEMTLSEWLGELAETPQQPQVYVEAIRAYLWANDGGNLGQVALLPEFEDFVHAIATLYARMVAGDGMSKLLEEMDSNQGVYTNGMATDCRVLVDSAKLQNGRPLPYRPYCVPNDSHLLQVKVNDAAIQSAVISEVASVVAIDLHTHLLPPSHGLLCCWGIDELLTYHYLVAEYFMTAPPSMTPEAFYAMNKKDQADVIWKALFIDRSPVSEACRGVITTLQQLGLGAAIEQRDLEAVRAYYSSFRDRGLEGAEDFSKLVYEKAGVRYAIMTNIPFDSAEASQWRPKRKEYPEHYRSALRVDPLLAGDRVTVEHALRSSGYDVTLEGARQYLRDWCDTMKPEYMMASTPHDFVLREGILSGVIKKGVNEDTMKQPFAFVDATNANTECAVNCDGEEDATASVIDENSDFLSEVLMKVCEERDLPVALKIGAHRGVNPRLKAAGDGVVAFADAGVLARLCGRFPKVRFLATFLSRNNQHEACIMASKFSNLHIYGCWWFCNNPSMIKEITKMRVEMLGTAFTAQHSDARVLDQLVYKWSHSRAVIAGVLVEEYAKLCESGWSFTREELRRDVKRLFGGSYEEFMAKSFASTDSTE